MEAILDFSAPLDVALLDKIVDTFNNPQSPQRVDAERVLTAFQEHADAWTRVDGILDATSNVHTKMIALQILEKLIKYRWKALPLEQREGVKLYLVDTVMKLAAEDSPSADKRIFLRKMNLLLVHVLKHEWPAQWPTFIPELIEASKTSELLCENNISILTLLSEEVFDFSKESLTTAKAEALKQSMKEQFELIFELLQLILDATTRPALIIQTLQCLQTFVTWIPDTYIFERPLLPLLCAKYLPVSAYREHTLLVLTEVVSLAKPEYDSVFEQLFIAVIQEIVRVIPGHVNMQDQFRKGKLEHQHFIRHLALFFSSYFKSHAELLESESLRPLLYSGMEYLVKISDIDDPEIFKICLDYWQKLANDLYSLEIHYAPALPGGFSLGAGGGGGAMLNINTNNNVGFGLAHNNSARKEIYKEILSSVRSILIFHMAKPEEVLIEKDATGEIVRARATDTEALSTYKVMKDTLVFLTHLDPPDTERIMLEKLATQVDNPAWTWEALSTLCWAIGSISGTMNEADEKRFLVTVIKDLLGMCEKVKGKNHKAVVASNIMYVVGQYPRFLKAHWKFLKTVVMKLFEFMHERHPGVQDMAVDTFLKIATKCKKKFVAAQPEQTHSFIQELAPQIPAITEDLEPYQILVFYEAAGQMVSAHPDAAGRQALTEQLLEAQNLSWGRLIQAAADDAITLQNVDTLRDLRQILSINTAACKSIGPQFDQQLGRMYLDMLNLHSTLSAMIKEAVAAQGEAIVQSTEVRAMRALKKDILTLVSTFINVAEDARFVATHFIPPLLAPVLEDYATCTPDARDAEVLHLMAEIIHKLKGDIAEDAPKILSVVFEPTLTMITANFEDYPDHRLYFFKLLEAINQNCFAALFQIPPEHTKLVIDSIVWAFKHTASDIGEMGLNILEMLLSNLSALEDESRQQFHLVFFLDLIKEVLTVLTDRFHKAHFKLHATILHTMFHLLESGAVTAPLWESPTAVETGAGAAFTEHVQQQAAANGGNIPAELLSNTVFVKAFVRGLVSSQFTNLDETQVESFVEGLFDMTRDLKAYKHHLRDFLIQVLEFKGDLGVEALFSEEQAAKVADDLERRKTVPGLLNPYQQQEEMDDI